MTKPTRWVSSTAALGLAAGLTLVGASPAMAATEVTVCATSCDYTAIQPAVDAASAGDTVTVSAGTYAESVVIDKTLTLSGPNTGVSPNSADPLTPNADRNAEAIIEPAAGATNHAFTVKGDGIDATISGFTVDLTGGAANQTYLRGGQLKDSHVTITNNILKNAKDQAEGWVWFNGDLGDITLSATDNRFANGGSSNGFRVYNGASSGTGSTELDIQNNVFIDNAGWTLNNSTKEVATTGTIAHNWFGNSDATAPETSHFGAKQSGLVLAGEYTNFDLNNNTFKNMTAVSLNLWSSLSGTMTINGNTFDGYNTSGGGAVLSVYKSSGGSPGDVSGLTLNGNAFTNPVGASIAVINKAGAGTLDVSGNLWDADPVAQMSGPNIQLGSWTLLDDGGHDTAVHVAENGETVEFGSAPGAPTITIPAGAITGSSTFEYFVRSINDTDLPSETPFDTDGATVFDLTLDTEGTVSGTFIVCVDAPEGMRLWHAESGVWNDVTVDGADAGQVCGEVTSFSPFALGGTGDAQLAATGVSADAVPGTLALTGILLVGGLSLLVASRRAARHVR